MARDEVRVRITAEADVDRAARETERRMRKMASEAERNFKKLKKSADAVSDSLAAMGAGIVFYQLVGGIEAAVRASNRFRAAEIGVSSVARKIGQEIASVNELLQELTRDGLLNLADASIAVQNLLASRFTLEETRGILLATKDAAAFNRQEMLSFGEAVRRTTEGIRLGLSQLSDAAGITKNLSTMLKEAGLNAEDLNKVTTDAAVRQALYNGFLREGAIFQGNAARLAHELAGQQARFAFETEQAKAALGDALAPALTLVLGKGTAWSKTLREWIIAHPEAARGITMIATGFIGAAAAATAAAAAAQLAIVAFAGAGRKIALAVGGVAALVGTLANLILQQRASERTAADQARQISELGERHQDLHRLLQDSNLTESERKRILTAIKDTITDLKRLIPDLVTEIDRETGAVRAATEQWRKLAVEKALAANPEFQRLNQELMGVTGNARDPLGTRGLLPDRRRIDDIRRRMDQIRREVAESLGFIETDPMADVMAGFDPRLDALRDELGVGRSTDQGTGKSLADRIRDVQRRFQAGWITAAEAVERLREMEKDLAKTEEDRLDIALAIQAIENRGAKQADRLLSQRIQAIKQEAALGDISLEQARERLEALRQEAREAQDLLEIRLAVRDVEDAIKEARVRAFQERLKAFEHEARMADLEEKAPQQFKAGLEAIEKEFADFLADPANVDLARAIRERIKQAGDAVSEAERDRLRKAFEDARDEVENQRRLMGSAFGPLTELDMIKATGLREKAAALFAAGVDAGPLFEVLGREAELRAQAQRDRFDSAMHEIEDDRRRRFAGLADEAQRLQKSMVDLEGEVERRRARGEDTAEMEARLSKIREQLTFLFVPALMAEELALNELLQDQSLKAEQRRLVEERLNQVKEELRQVDLRHHELVEEAKTRATHRAVQEREKAERRAAEAIRDVRSLLRRAQEIDLESLRRGQEAAERRQQARVEGLREELRLLEQRHRAEERAQRIAELREALARAEREGPAEEFITETGERIFRNLEAERLRGELAEAEKQDAFEQERERLRALIETEERRLQALREGHQRELAARQSMWQNIQSLDDQQLKGLIQLAEQNMGKEGWFGVMEKWLDEAKKHASTTMTSVASHMEKALKRAREAERELQGIVSRVGGPGGINLSGVTAAGAGGGITVGTIHVNPNIHVPPGADPAQVAALVRSATKDAVLDALREAGRAQDRAGLPPE